MAKVICSPTVKGDCRRKLPVGSLIEADPHGLQDQGSHALGDTPAAADAHTCPAPEPVDASQLTSERDAALERASSAETKLTRISEGLVTELEKAREKGYADGLKRAEEEMAAKQNEEIEALKALVKKLTGQQESLIRMAEDAAVEIGFAAAAKILGKSHLDRRLVVEMVQEAMRQVSEREGLVIHLTGGDCRIMEAIKAQNTNGNKWSKIEFKEDEEVGLGGCIINSRVGALDARLDHQLEALKQQLLKARAQEAREEE